jgi:hypothetical protein
MYAPAQDISDELMDLGFDIIRVKQMSTTRRSTSEGTPTTNLPLFLITLLGMAKTQEIRVEAYKGQNNLTQCHNCQQFDHFWANCK